MAAPSWTRVSRVRVQTHDGVGGEVTHVDFERMYKVPYVFLL